MTSVPLFLFFGLLLIAVFIEARPEQHVPVPVERHRSVKRVLTNTWHVSLRDGGKDRAHAVAKDTGFRFVRQHLNEPNEFLFEHPTVAAASIDPSDSHHRLLVNHPSVTQATQLEGFLRKKRGQVERSKKGIPNRKSKITRAGPFPNDPLFPKEWYIRNTGQAQGTIGLDLNVMSAWSAGITGRGVTTAIMDDGIDYLHPDIASNFNFNASYDFSSNDPYPYPRYTDDWFNSHGTRCAGEIASIRDNGVCGVGVAYNSKVAGLRMLDQPFMTDLIEAAAMVYARDEIDIYSASWGPTDDGKTVDGPRNQTMKAIVDGVNKGRHGRGNIYVWASGDGGAKDDCNCDGYAASMWTISINSATNDGETASYDESCSSTLASTFSNGKAWYSKDAGVGTIDLYGKCTLHHSGTSAAAPEAAGVFALALEANPNLTWRDMQHLTVLTSKRNHLHDGKGKHQWVINGAGLEFNHLFGFGVLDAGDIVKTAKHWKNVPERFHCIANTMKGVYHFDTRKALVLKINTDACQQDPAHRVNFIEHVQAYITLRASRRGDVNIFLTSPMGTTSMILSKRDGDADSDRGFTNWPFMTTQTWAENPRGEWRLTVVFDTEDAVANGVLTKFTLAIHGTQEPPYAKLPESLSTIIPKLGMVKRQHQTFRFAF